MYVIQSYRDTYMLNDLEIQISDMTALLSGPGTMLPGSASATNRQAITQTTRSNATLATSSQA